MKLDRTATDQAAISVRSSPSFFGTMPRGAKPQPELVRLGWALAQLARPQTYAVGFDGATLGACANGAGNQAANLAQNSRDLGVNTVTVFAAALFAPG